MYPDYQSYHLILKDTDNSLPKQESKLPYYNAKTIGPVSMYLTKPEEIKRRFLKGLGELENEFKKCCQNYENYTPKLIKSKDLLDFLNT